MTLLIVLIVCVPSQFSFGALNAYLRLTGETQGPIEGSVTEAGREGLIMVIAYSHIISSVPDTETCQSSGNLNHLPFKITKEIDKATPLLLAAFANAHIEGIHQEMLNNKYPENASHNVREHVSFSYGQITRIIVNEGIIASDDWNSVCGQHVLTSDLNFDGTVNLLDLYIMANEWMQSGL